MLMSFLHLYFKCIIENRGRVKFLLFYTFPELEALQSGERSP